MGRRSIVVLSLVALSSVLSSSAGHAVSLPHPEPAHRLTVQGFVTGELAKDRRVRFHLVGTDPKGWLHLESFRVAVVLHGQPIQEITYTLDGAEVGVTGSDSVPAGSPTRLRGSFLDVHPGAVRLVRQTFSLRVVLWATVSADFPSDAEFVVTATDTDGRVSLVRRPARLAAGFLSWGTLGLAVAIALFLGAFVGNTFSSRRRRKQTPSIWDVVERRLREQRARRPALAQDAGGDR